MVHMRAEGKSIPFFDSKPLIPPAGVAHCACPSTTDNTLPLSAAVQGRIAVSVLSVGTRTL